MLILRRFLLIIPAKKRIFRMILYSLVISAALALLLSTGTTALNPEASRAVPCDNPRPLGVKETLGQSQSWPTIQAEWIHFKVQKGNRYLLQVSSAEDLELAVFDRCDTTAPAVALQGGQVEFTATRDGDYYLLVRNAGLSSAGLTGYQVTLLPAAPHRANTVTLQEVPEDVLRRATDFLEELRGSDLAPEWKEARISRQVRILYRPDMITPAYYEVTVEKPAEQGWIPAGFIQLAAGEHDYPIVNWDMTGMSNTQELAELAPLGAVLTEFYRLNTLSYVSEYETPTAIGINTLATEIVNLGELPVRIEGLNAIPEEPFDLVTQSIDSDGVEEYDGPAELPLLEESSWESWAALKEGYEQEYGPLLKSLKERASSKWELEENLSKYGETLVKGDVRTLTGLAAHTISAVQVTGEGAAEKYLKQELTSSKDVPTGIILTVLDEPADADVLLPFEVVLEYTNGISETTKFAIANHTALRGANSIFIPLLRSTGSPSLANASVAPTAATTWGPWHYYWAADSTGSIVYNQIPAHTGVNTSGCWSGCGATAWAMEFAWVDRMAAAGVWPWTNHWGLYRTNGGLGANAVAPFNQDAGVNNMTWEIRNYLGTFCSGGGGSTYFTRMIDAYRYVQPRASTGWRMSTRYDPTGLCWFGACNEARELARYQIVNRQAPAIIGANNHYPLAYGYAWQSETSCFLWWCSTNYNRWFYVNQGWGGNGNGWVDWDDVAFAGIYYPW